MKESVIYQEIQATSKAEGEAIGRQKGDAIGEARGRQQGEANLVILLLQQRFGEIPSNLTEQLRQLSVERLENLARALLDFQTLGDLVNWLETLDKG